jgi:serine/threonine-protein kinase RsbW
MREPLRIARQAHLEDLRALLDFTRDACARLGLDDDATFRIRLAVEEACMNLIEHGYPPGPPGPIELAITGDDDRVVVGIRDRAPPFDPAAVPPPDLAAEWQNRRIGGLGWHLINQVMDEVRYESDAAGNLLTLVKQRAAGRGMGEAIRGRRTA